MKKNTLSNVIIFILLPVLIACTPLVLMAAASGENTSYDWYFKPNETHEQPALIPEATFLNEYKSVIALGNKDEKKLYLTFDAGYDNGCMADILDTLKEKKVSAAFFVDGNFVKNNAELVCRISSEGHVLGNHSLSHADMSRLTDFEKYKEQIRGWDKLVTEAGATPTIYFRFPCGRFSRQALDYNEKLGIKSVFWSFAYYDWDTAKQPDRQAALNKIISRTHNGAVLLLHSVSRTNADILGEYIDKMRADGYTFDSIANL